MWTYRQKTGELLRDGKHIAWGYSGHAAGRNNPFLQNVMDVGPIPAGRWRITEMVPLHKTLGPYVLRLAPAPGTEVFGRSAFRIHGNNASNDASEGCIILPRAIRVIIWCSGDRDLEVVGEDMLQVA